MIPFSRRAVADTPIAIVDLETTGLVDGSDKIVEIAVVRIEPGEAPRLVLDTLVNPRRRVTGTEIHGIRPGDVRGAPEFRDLEGEIKRALSGAVLAAYNVYFDVRFLEAEFPAIGLEVAPPHLCLMYLGPMLGTHPRMTLADACREHGLAQGGLHRAAADAMAAAALWSVYLPAMRGQGVEEFGQLARLKKYKFVQSFSNPMIEGGSDRAPATLKPRQALPTRPLPAAAPKGAESSDVFDALGLQVVTDSGRTPEGGLQVTVKVEGLPTQPLAEYWDAMVAACEDFEFSAEELAHLAAKRKAPGLTEEQVRWVHARAFALALEHFGRDRAIDAGEVDALRRMSDGLRRLGWAPGEGIEPRKAQGAPRPKVPPPLDVPEDDMAPAKAADGLPPWVVAAVILVMAAVLLGLVRAALD